MPRTNLNFDNTIVQLNLLKKQILRISFIISIISSVIFIGLYIYQLCTNLDDVIRIVLFSCILAILVTILGVDIAIARVTKYSTKRKLSISTLFTLKCIKYFICFLSWGYTAYEVVFTQVSDFTKMMALVSLMGLLGSFAAELIRVFAIKYIDTLTISIKMDLEGNIIGELTDRMGYEKPELSSYEIQMRERISEDTQKYGVKRHIGNGQKEFSDAAKGLAVDLVKEYIAKEAKKINNKISALRPSKILISKKKTKHSMKEKQYEDVIVDAVEIAKQYNELSAYSVVPVLGNYLRANIQNVSNDAKVLNAFIALQEVALNKSTRKAEKLIKNSIVELNDVLDKYIDITENK